MALQMFSLQMATPTTLPRTVPRVKPGPSPRPDDAPLFEPERECPQETQIGTFAP